jgi:hypothetical protein
VAVVNGVCACKASCESLVREAEEYLSLAKQSVKKASATYNRHAIFNFLIGMLFAAVGFLPVFTHKNYGAFFLVPLGFLFLLTAYFNKKSATQIKTNENV